MSEQAKHPLLLQTAVLNWQTEMTHCEDYRTLAHAETDSRRRNVLRGIGAAEKHHARLWAARIVALGGPIPTDRRQPSGEVASPTRPEGGVDGLLRRLRVEERDEIGRYKDQLSVLTEADPSRSTLQEVLADENEHYKSISSLIRDRPALPPLEKKQASKALAALLASRRKRRPEAAEWANDAVYAAHDGLGSIFGIVSGVAGATLGKSHFVLLAGLAGMVGGALSAGTGAYLTAKSERDLFEAGIKREREAVENDEGESRDFLSLSLQVRGLPQDVAGRLSHLLSDDKEEFVRALVRTRNGLPEEGLSNPWTSAVTVLGATALGAFLPIIPFFFLAGGPGMIAAAGVALTAHFVIGASRSVMTLKIWWRSGLELAAFGAIEGILTFGIGMALGRLVGMK